jgi:tRNA1Val (adenine37-N6)-methyltransferase
MINPHPQANRFFQFKQFSLTDQGCGMKIGTDGVLLGSIAARYKSRVTLDVGSGCGLIALMVAQKSSAKIIALEIDNQAAKTASQNIKNSPWPSRIEVINQSFQDFSKECGQVFDLIVCNPPFFHNSFPAPNQERNIARHSNTLTPAELMQEGGNLLSTNGKLLVIIPFEQETLYQKAASAQGLICGMMIRVIPKMGMEPKRSILEFSKNDTETRVEQLFIETGQRHAYTQQYIDLTKDYYLYM